MSEWKDPVVEEIHSLREQYVSQLKHDLDAIFEDIQKRQVTKQVTPSTARKKSLRGSLKHHANPTLMEQERDAWQASAGEKHLNKRIQRT
jgi:hypothetical protein